MTSSLPTPTITTTTPVVTLDDFFTSVALGEQIDHIIQEVVPAPGLPELIRGYAFDDPPCVYYITYQTVIFRVTAARVELVKHVPYDLRRMFGVKGLFKYKDCLFVYGGNVSEITDWRYDLVSSSYCNASGVTPKFPENVHSSYIMHHPHSGNDILVTIGSFGLCQYTDLNTMKSYPLAKLCMYDSIEQLLEPHGMCPVKVTIYNNTIYVFGFNVVTPIQQTEMSYIWRLSKDLVSWEMVSNSMPIEVGDLMNCQVVVIEERILFFSREVTGYWYLPTSNTWEEIPNFIGVLGKDDDAGDNYEFAFYDKYSKKLVVCLYRAAFNIRVHDVYTIDASLCVDAKWKPVTYIHPDFNDPSGCQMYCHVCPC